MSKYIIKNCPSTYQNFEDKYICTSQVKQRGLTLYCQDCTDCVIKQIAKKCRLQVQGIGMSGKNLAEKIFGLLDIQEVE